MSVSFFVHGEPRPQGSKKAYTPKGWSRPVLVESSKDLKPWRQEVAKASMLARPRDYVFPREAEVELTFAFLRPKGHMGAKGNLKPSAPRRCNVRPDADKLARAILDSLKGTLLSDDSSVVSLRVEKHYVVDAPGCHVTVREGK